MKRVVTEHSDYVLDEVAGTLTRVPRHTEAAGLRRDGEPVSLLKVLRLAVGEPAVFVVEGLADGVTTVRHTTPVVAVEDDQ